MEIKVGDRMTFLRLETGTRDGKTIVFDRRIRVTGSVVGFLSKDRACPGGGWVVREDGASTTIDVYPNASPKKI